MAKKEYDKNLYEILFNKILDSNPNDATKVTKDFPKETNALSEERRAREKAYTILTEAYAENYKKTHRQKRRLKLAFFWIIMPLFVGVITCACFALIKALFIDGPQTEVVIGSVISLVSAIIAIPTIIAKYLFPTGEDKDMTEMIKEMQNYDNMAREFETKLHTNTKQ